MLIDSDRIPLRPRTASAPPAPQAAPFRLMGLHLLPVPRPRSHSLEAPTTGNHPARPGTLPLATSGWSRGSPASVCRALGRSGVLSELSPSSFPAGPRSTELITPGEQMCRRRCSANRALGRTASRRAGWRGNAPPLSILGHAHLWLRVSKAPS